VFCPCGHSSKLAIHSVNSQLAAHDSKEDEVYERPADDTRAAELWMNASLWLKVDKLAHIHTGIIHALKKELEQMTGDLSLLSWHNHAVTEFGSDFVPCQGRPYQTDGRT
jgi:hypothetical protein